MTRVFRALCQGEPSDLYQSAQDFHSKERASAWPSLGLRSRLGRRKAGDRDPTFPPQGREAVKENLRVDTTRRGEGAMDRKNKRYPLRRAQSVTAFVFPVT